MADSIERGGDYAIFSGGAAGVCKAKPGVLQKVVVTGTLTGTLTIHDNPSAASGNLLLSVATPTAGTIYDLGFETKFGIYVTPGTAGSVLVAYD